MYNTFTTIDDVREKIKSLVGSTVEFEINKGRNKIVHCRAEVVQAYPSLFTIKPETECDLDRMSYSYCDVVCGEIKF